MLGFRDSFLIAALVFTLALIPAWIMGSRRMRDEDGDEIRVTR
jgi:hypothetical protein